APAAQRISRCRLPCAALGTRPQPRHLLNRRREEHVCSGLAARGPGRNAGRRRSPVKSDQGECNTLLDREMKTLEQYLDDAAVAHGPRCAGQLLGVRMAMLGLKKLGIEDPQGEDRKRIVTFVEIDRCATDAVMVVTGCRLGKRALKFRDWGKVAATFVDVETGKAVRISARESSKALAKSMHPEIADKNQQQMLAYREITDELLFQTQWVHVELPPEEFPGYKGERVVCERCGEGINFRREVRLGGKILCRGCAGERYYEPIV